MIELTEIFKNSFSLIFSLNLDLLEIILLSLKKRPISGEAYVILPVIIFSLGMA